MTVRHLLRFAIVAVGFAISSCGKSESYKSIGLNDPKLAEFSDLFNVDRAALGIPALPAVANIETERSNGSAYDAMLHVYAYPHHQQRTIAFRLTHGTMKWIQEQVVVDGPRQYTTVDGTSYEEIVVDYGNSASTSEQPNQLVLSYHGPEAALNAKASLTLADVKPYLDLWLARP